MRVLMITPDHLMIDRRILQEAQTLRAAGYDVEILAGFECPQPSSYEHAGVRIDRFTFDWSDTRLQRILRPLRLRPGRLRTMLWIALRRALTTFTGLSSFQHYVLRRIMERDYDILHCHDFPLLAAAVEAKRRRGKPLVYDAHELYHAQVQLPASRRRRYRAREARLIGHADLAVTVNPFLATIMADDYGCTPPEVILNATPLSPRDGLRPVLREKLGFTDRDRIVLYQGWMSPERRLDRLVRAACLFPPHVHLIVIGYGVDEAQLHTISIKQGTNDGRVIFLGRVETEELASLTPSADLGVIPYHAIDLNNQYCSPNKLYEFLAAGVPFVCSDLPYLRSVVDAYGCGVIADFARPEAAAQAILAVLDDAERLRRLKHAARAAAEVLNWEVEGRKLVRLYQRIVPTFPH